MSHREPKLRIWMGVAALSLFILLLTRGVIAAPSNTSIQVKIDSSQATPRDVEDQTRESIVRDYGKAWQSLEQALENNRADALNANFVGYARDRWGGTVSEQAKAGMSRRVVDRGHQLQVVFYSVEGSAMELRDTAQLEIQYLEGGKVVHSERVTSHYMVLMTPAENSWKVRILQEVPSESPQQAADFRVSGEGTGSK
jgi:hypothetical protein